MSGVHLNGLVSLNSIAFCQFNLILILMLCLYFLKSAMGCKVKEMIAVMVNYSHVIVKQNSYPE